MPKRSAHESVGINPLLAVGRMLIAEGHEVVGLSGSALHDRIEGIGAEQHVAFGFCNNLGLCGVVSFAA
jgi:hypothetical protein